MSKAPINSDKGSVLPNERVILCFPVLLMLEIKSLMISISSDELILPNNSTPALYAILDLVKESFVFLRVSPK